MTNSDQDSKVTLEDLLRLKRSERPDAEFWANFEQELRQKQLTALVKKRRLWHELPILLNRKFYMPAGAAAIVAFTLVTVRFSNSTPLAGEVVAPQVMAQSSPVEMLAAIEVEVTETAQPQSRRFEEPIARSSDTEATLSASVATAPKIAVESRTNAPRMPLSRAADSTVSSPLLANFVSLDTAEPESINAILSGRLSSSAHVQKVAAVQSDVAEVSNAAAGKYRLIARYAETSLSPEPMAPALVRERLARRLGDDLGDSISRIGVVGSRVSLKF